MKPVQTNKSKILALAGTIIFHAIVIFLLFIWVLKTPLPLPGEQGIEVSFGNSNTGMGIKSSQPRPQKKIIKKKPVIPVKQYKKKVTASKKILTQNIEKTPSIPTKKKVITKPKNKIIKSKPIPLKKTHKPDTNVVKEVLPKEKKIVKPKPKVNKRALFKLRNNTGKTQKGLKAGTGVTGKPHGLNNSNRTTGQGGKGNGVSYSLGGRGASFLERPAARFNEQGTVIIKIWVNPSGKVIRAAINAKGTSIVNEKLREMALKAAKNSRFSTNPTAPPEQIGTITYRFILKK